MNTQIDMATSKSEPKIETIVLTLDGELMEGGNIEYKTLIDIIEGAVGAIEGTARVANFKNPVAFNVQPPKEKCFEISLQVVEWMGATATLFPNAPSIKDIITFGIEYLKIKKAMKGEPVKSGNVQTIENGNTTIKNDSGTVVYNDNKVNINLLLVVQEDPQVNKKLDKVVKAIEGSNLMDTLTYELVGSGEKFQIPKAEVDYYKYHEKVEQKPDSVVGRIREINNKTYRGVIVVDVDGKDKGVDFEVDIKDIGLLEKVVSSLAHAEADKSRVVFRGEKVLDSKGKLKKIIVNDVDIPDVKFGF